MLTEQDIWQHCPTSALMMEKQRVNELLAQFRVAAVMALHPPMIALDAPLSDAARLFADSGRAGIVVVEHGMSIGFLTEENFMRAAEYLLSDEGRRKQGVSLNESLQI
jgi:CBS domain-containing protein